MFYRTNGIIYKIMEFQDYDKIVWILSPKGKISAIAKGVRKISSRRAGHIEIFNHNKFSLNEGKSMDSLSEIVAISDYSALKKHFTFHIFFLTEIIDKITLEDYEAKIIYDLLIKTLDNANLENFKSLLVAFEIKLLKILGFEPNLRTFQDTENDFDINKNLYLNHLTPGYTEKNNNAEQISPTIIKCQRYYLTTESIDATMSLKVDSNTIDEMLKINATWLQNVLDIKFKSLEFLNLDK